MARARARAGGQNSLRRRAYSERGHRLRGDLRGGLGLDRFHRLGYGLSSTERRHSYQAAFERGKGIVEVVLRGMKKGNAA